MPKVGEEEFAYTQEGIAEAKAMSEETGIPITNAPDRVEKYQLGGMTKPPTSPSITPTSSYKKGGKVDVTDIVKKVGKKVAQEKRFDKRIKEADKKGETIQSGAKTFPMSDKLKYEKKGHKGLKEGQINKMAKSIRKQKRKKK